MAIFHSEFKIICRSKGQMATAAAAYRSGTRIHDDETGMTHDYTKKSGVIYSEIMLPVNAPEVFLDREYLWNSVEKIEKRIDAQMAREAILSLPRELTHKQQIECVRSLISENYVAKGMIADWALHDKGEGNPHAHIMLTVRAFTEDKKWAKKKTSVFCNFRDDQGRPIYDPQKPCYDPKRKEETAQYRIPKLDAEGNQMYRQRPGKGREMLWERKDFPVTDWDDRSNVEKWRAQWEECCNRYLSPEHHIDHRSYVRQGIDREPTIYEGFIARKIEKRGGVSNRMEHNRGVRKRNTVRDKVKQIMMRLKVNFLKKARDISDRFRDFDARRKINSKGVQELGTCTEAAGHDRAAGEGNLFLSGEAGGIARFQLEVTRAEQGLKRTEQEIKRTEQEIKRTEQEIIATEQKIKEFDELKQRKESEFDERFRQFKERRDAVFDGTYVGRNERPENTELSIGREEHGAFLERIRAQRRIAGAVTRDSEAQRHDREITQKRFGVERSQEYTERSQEYMEQEQEDDLER